MPRNLLQETNHVTLFNGDERFFVSDDPSGTPADGYTTSDDIRNNVEWQIVTVTWTRVGANSFRVTGDVTATYLPGLKVRYKAGAGYQYGVVGSATYSAPNTTVQLLLNGDYVIPIAATLTDTYISNHSFPTGWPEWFGFNSTLTGFSVNPPSVIYRWRASGRMVELVIRQLIAGTSNSTAFTLSAPVAASNVTDMSWAGEALGVDNGGVLTTPSRLTIAAGTSTITAYKDYGSGNWTATGDKRLPTGRIVYEFG